MVDLQAMKGTLIAIERETYNIVAGNNRASPSRTKYADRRTSYEDQSSCN